MTTNFAWESSSADNGEWLASFGGARLIKHHDGTCEICGGNSEERGEARDWVTLFLQHVILRAPRRTRPAAVAHPGWQPPVRCSSESRQN
jgi:hypothetical protein